MSTNDRNQRGAAMVEYALVIAFIAVMSVAAASYLGLAVGNDFDNVDHQGLVAGGDICNPAKQVCS